MAYLPLNDRMELGMRRESLVSQREIHMQDIDVVNDENTSVWIHEMHVVSSTPIRARKIRKSLAPSPYHQPTLFRNASVNGFPDVSPVRKTLDSIRSSVLKENPDVQVNELGPSNVTPTRTRRNISRQALNPKICQSRARKDTHRNVPKRPPMYASQRIEQYEPLVLLSDDDENIGQNLNACQRKRIRNSKPSVQFRSTGKALLSNCESIDSGRGVSEAISSGIRTVTSVGRGDDEESVNNDHESSSDSGVNHDPGNVYDNKNSHAISRVSGPQSHSRIKNQRPKRRESEHAKQLIENPVSQLVASIQWKSGFTDEYPPLDIVNTDKDINPILRRKKIVKRGMKQTAKGIIQTDCNEQEDYTEGMEGRQSGRIRPLKCVEVNSNLSSSRQMNGYSKSGDVVKRKENDVYWTSDEECAQEEEEVENMSLERLHYQRNFKRKYSHREISPPERVNFINNSYSLNVNGNKVDGDIAEENFEDEEISEEMTSEEMTSEESLCDDDEAVVLGNSRSGNTLRNCTDRRSYINKPSHNFSYHKGTQNFSYYNESSDIYIESDYEGSLEMNGLIERNPPKVSDRMSCDEDLSEQDDEYFSDASGPIAEGSHRIESPHSSFIEDNYELSKDSVDKRRKQQKFRKELSQDNINQVSTAAVEKKAKKRGRPKKSNVTSAEVSGSKVAKIAKKRGRPPLSSSDKKGAKDTKGPVKRKNGTNKKSTSTESFEGTCSPESLENGAAAKKEPKKSRRNPKKTCTESSESAEMENKNSDSEESVTKKCDAKKRKVESVKATMGKKNQKSISELSQDNVNRDVSTATAETKPKKRGRKPQNSTTSLADSKVNTTRKKRGRPPSSSSEKEGTKAENGTSIRKDGANITSTTRKKRGRPPSSSSEKEGTKAENGTSIRKDGANITSSSTELSEEKNMLPKRKSLLNTAETNVQLSKSESKENFIPEATIKETSVETSGSISSLSAKRKSQRGSSSDYLRKKVLTMKLGNSLLHTSVIENNEHVITSTPIKPQPGRSLSSTQEKGTEQASINCAAKGKILSKTILGSDKITSEENHENSVSERDKSANDDSKKGKKTTPVLDSEKKICMKTLQPALTVDENLLCLPSKKGSNNDTQSTSKRRGFIATSVDGKEKELELFSEYSQIHFRSRHKGTKDQDDNVQYGAGLDVLGLGTGYIHLAPGSEKGLQHPKWYNMVFLVLDGTVKVKIHESELLTKPGDFFAVPKGCKYNLIGSGDKNAVVAYFRCKAL